MCYGVVSWYEFGGLLVSCLVLGVLLVLLCCCSVVWRWWVTCMCLLIVGFFVGIVLFDCRLLVLVVSLA